MKSRKTGEPAVRAGKELLSRRVEKEEQEAKGVVFFSRSLFHIIDPLSFLFVCPVSSLYGVQEEVRCSWELRSLERIFQAFAPEGALEESDERKEQRGK